MMKDCSEMVLVIRQYNLRVQGKFYGRVIVSLMFCWVWLKVFAFKAEICWTLDGTVACSVEVFLWVDLVYKSLPQNGSSSDRKQVHCVERQLSLWTFLFGCSMARILWNFSKISSHLMCSILEWGWLFGKLVLHIFLGANGCIMYSIPFPFSFAIWKEKC